MFHCSSQSLDWADKLLIVEITAVVLLIGILTKKEAIAGAMAKSILNACAATNLAKLYFLKLIFPTGVFEYDPDQNSYYRDKYDLTIDGYSFPLLKSAIQNNNKKLQNFLVDTLGLKPSSEWLYKACKDNNAVLVKAYLEIGCDIKRFYDDVLPKIDKKYNRNADCIAIYWACLWGSENIIKVLWNKNELVYEFTKEDCLLQSTASSLPGLKALELLLEKSKKETISTRYFYTILIEIWNRLYKIRGDSIDSGSYKGLNKIVSLLEAEKLKIELDDVLFVKMLAESSYGALKDHNHSQSFNTLIERFPNHCFDVLISEKEFAWAIELLRSSKIAKNSVNIDDRNTLLRWAYNLNEKNQFDELCDMFPQEACQNAILLENVDLTQKLQNNYNIPQNKINEWCIEGCVKGATEIALACGDIKYVNNKGECFLHAVAGHSLYALEKCIYSGKVKQEDFLRRDNHNKTVFYIAHEKNIIKAAETLKMWGILGNNDEQRKKFFQAQLYCAATVYECNTLNDFIEFCVNNGADIAKIDEQKKKRPIDKALSSYRNALKHSEWNSDHCIAKEKIWHTFLSKTSPALSNEALTNWYDQAGFSPAMKQHAIGYHGNNDKESSYQCIIPTH
jgi:hypothetical protein